MKVCPVCARGRPGYAASSSALAGDQSAWLTRRDFATMLATPLRRLRSVGLLEGLSYLVLLGIAMPLKYYAGRPEVVTIVGGLHGGLFILFFGCVAEVTIRRPWWSPKFWLAALVAALVPGGTFVFDRWLKGIENADQQRRLDNALVKD